MVVGEDGNVTLTGSLSKSLSSLPITQLITYDDTTKKVTVNKEFDIEYIYTENATSYYMTRLTVSKGVYKVSNKISICHMADIILQGSTSSRCYIYLDYGVFGVIILSKDATQLTTEEISGTSDGRYYRLYV